jgi:succinate dehydrogenase / fumarate reductase cytochrome b subunit
MTGGERHFWLRRLHSLSGIVPVGGFLAFHLYENYSATRGPEAYNAMTRRLQEIPFALALEIAVIAVPLFFHGIYGLFVTGTARPNVITNAYVRNWMYLVQRVTGVVLFAVVIFNLWTTRFVDQIGRAHV